MKKHQKPATVLNDPNIKPLTQKEYREERLKWAQRQLHALLGYAHSNREFAEYISEAVADALGQDVRCADIMRDAISDNRKNKAKVLSLQVEEYLLFQLLYVV